MRKFFQVGPAARRWLLGGAALAAGLGLAAFRGPLLDGNPVQVIAQKLNAYYTLTQPEKVYLSLDRPAYGTGETAYFSAFVVDALRHQPDTLSKVLHVDLLSPTRQVVERRTLRVLKGRAYGDLDLSDTLEAGTYLLRAYTTWMLNGNPNLVYQRRLQVFAAAPNPDGDDAAAAATAPLTKAPAKAALARPDVQLFPEGGTFVAGLPTVVGFKAVAPTGHGQDVSGQVLDGQGRVVVAAFSSLHGGMGSFSFTPAAGQSYRARVRLADGSAADYPLPAAQPGGYTLHVQDAGDAFVVEARYRAAAGTPAPGPVALVSEVRGFLVGLSPRPITPDGQPTTWRVPKKSYPNGIVHFTLFDAASLAQAERLAFVLNGPAALKITLTPDRAAYAPHQQVRLKLQVADAAGQPVATHLAVSVAEAGAAALDPEGGNVVTNLLLTSDLAGYVENPGYYFPTAPTPATTQALDHLLLTQGWRRFVWKEVLAPTPPALPYPHESSLSLTGTVTGMGSRGLANGQLTFIQTKPNRTILEATTGPDGRFNFTGFTGQDTSVVTLQARRAGGASNVTIRPDNGPSVVGPLLPPLPTAASVPGLADYVRRSRQQQSLDRERQPDYSVARNIRLGNVAVTAKRTVIAPDDSRRLYPGVVANTMVDIANMPAAQSGIPLFTLLQGRVAGLTITGNPPDQSISIRNQEVQTFILDGVRTDASAINNIPTSDVEAVEVFKGGEAAIFGSGSGGGVIAVYTKRANKNFRTNVATPGLITVKLPGYYQAREFYTPRYGAMVVNASTGTDPRRLTLYWNAEAATDANGQADVYFFTADASGNFQATAEGISLSGLPARGAVQLYVAPK